MAHFLRHLLFAGIVLIVLASNCQGTPPGHNVHYNRWKRALVATKAVWIESTNGDAPPHSVPGGREANNERTYLCRMTRVRDLLPGKLVSSLHKCYVSYGGREYSSARYQVLTDPGEHSFLWVAGSGSTPPPRAVAAGSAVWGRDTLYICRYTIGSTLVTGKYHPSHQRCYVPYGGNEKYSRDFEVLTYKL